MNTMSEWIKEQQNPEPRAGPEQVMSSLPASDYTQVWIYFSYTAKMLITYCMLGLSFDTCTVHDVIQ